LDTIVICWQKHCSLLSDIVYEQPWAYTLFQPKIMFSLFLVEGPG